ncbi:MAG TPA: site-specific DNA-methyltransferase [Acidimicrobiales bacterium]|nr:site-specific DNA-methyltransferase [Acidimicrobiales bacterium]
MATRTQNFGAGKRESHDASDFYARFTPPSLSPDATLGDPSAIPVGCLLGDARDLSAIPDATVALVVTSPPYFAGKAYEEALGEGGIPGSYLEFLAMLRDVFAECVRVLEPGGRIAVNVANLGRKPYRSLAADVVSILQDDLGMLLRGEVVWAKAEGASGSCAWGSFKSPANPVLRDVTERVVIASKGRFDRAGSAAQRRKDGRPATATATNDEFLDATIDVWRFAPESAKRVSHPAPFPVELPERLIHLFTYEGDVVLDPFCGSGTTLVAAARTGRIGVGFDTDPTYVSIANRRAAGGEAGDRGQDDRYQRARLAGKAISALAESTLVEAGFAIDGRSVRLKRTGTSADLVACDAAGRRWYVEVVGGFTVAPSGLARMDGVYRALGRGALLEAAGYGPRLLLTSHLPTPGTEADVAWRSASGGLYDAALEVLDDDTPAALSALASRGSPLG